MSVLIKDAFRILSESYIKISEIATESLDLANSPAQPAKNDQLIQVSMLYSIVSDLLILNDAGTAIIGTKNQSVSKINALLLKLKKAAGIYTLPVFPTPLSAYQFNFGSNDADFDITAGQLGDLIVHNGTLFTNFSKGPDGYVLVSTVTGLQWQSVVGNGIPSGGTTGQVLKKNSNSSYDVSWDTLDPTDIGVSASVSELNILDGALFSTAQANTLVGINTGLSIQNQLDAKMNNSLATGSFFVGQSNVATAVAPSGDVTFNSSGVFSITALSIVDGDIATNAAIGRGKLASGSSNRLIINNASGVMTDANAITANEVLVSNADGIPIGSGISTTQFSYYDISSSLQASLDERLVVNLGTLAQGDLIVYNGSQWINLGLGTSGQVLTSNGTTAVWGSAAANGLPTGGTANQFLTKIDATDYNTTWSTLTLSLVTDVTASASEVNKLTGALFSVAEANTLVGMDSTPIQTQLNQKLSNNLAINAVWVGGGGNTAQQVSAGANGSIFTIVSGVPTWQLPPTPGNVSGPVSSTDNAITRWNGTGGNSIQNSGVLIDDSNNILLPTGAAIRTSTSSGNTLLLQAYDVDGAAYTTFATLTAGNTPTFDLNTSTTIGTAYVYRIGGTDVSLADGGTGSSLSDPGANTAMVWDNTLNQVRFALLSGLTYDSATNTLTASGGGGGISGPGSSTDNALVRWDGAGGSAVNNSGVILDDSNNLSGLANITLTTGSALRTSTSDTNTLLLQAYDVDGAAYTTFATLTAGNTPTMNLNTAVTIGSAYIYRVGGTDVSLADGGTGASLSDPGADRIMFWDNSAGAVDWLTVGTGITLSGTTISADTEYIQDSVGNILGNTTTINLTYSDATPSITADVNDGSISNSKIRTSAALSVIGRSSNSIGNVADITAGADYNILRRSGTSIGFGSIDLSQSGAVGSSILPVANGGTGVSTGAWLSSSGTTLLGPNTITGSLTNTLKFNFNSLGITQTNGSGLWIANNTPALLNNQQFSPSLVFEGQGWETTGSTSQSIKFNNYISPIQSTNLSGNLVWGVSLSGSAYSTLLTLSSGGTLNGSNFVATTMGSQTNTINSLSQTPTTLLTISGSSRNNTSSVYNIINGTVGFNPSSGTSEFNYKTYSGSLQQTGGAVGSVTIYNSKPTVTIAGITNLTGYDWNPTLTGSISGAHLAWRNTSGRLLFGGTTITSGSVLADFQSTTLGLLVPRVTNIASVSTPVNGMVAYDATTNLWNFRQNNSWVNINSGITNTAINNELMKSDGTNAVPSDIFVVGSNFTLGSSSSAATLRSIFARSSSGNTNLSLVPEGTGFLNVNTTQPVYFVQSGVGALLVSAGLRGSDESDPGLLSGVGSLTIRGGTRTTAGLAPGDVSILSGTPGAGGPEGSVNIQSRSTGKLGFFNVSAISRVTTSVSGSTFVANTSGIVNDTATWDGYTTGQIVRALKNYGLLT